MKLIWMDQKITNAINKKYDEIKQIHMTQRSAVENEVLS